MDIDAGKVDELAASIDQVGLLQAVLLRPLAERYEMVAGYRRLLAFQKLNLEEIDAVVTKMSDEQAAVIRATENLSRENLTPLEEAVIFSNLVNVYKMEFDEVGRKFGYQLGTIRRRLDLLKMPEVLRYAVHEKKISVTVAEELWPISDEGDLLYYLTFAIESGCTKATARGWTKDWRDSKRRENQPGGEGRGGMAPNEPRPTYVPCDLCTGPMVIGDDIVLRVCANCHKVIKENM
jgi:ParB/RepB/Spo0J family partition protein